MAVLSVPSNTPTIDGATAVCTSDDATGTVYLSVRTDRAWYSVANGDSQELADADKATIISQTVAGAVVFVDTVDPAVVNPSVVISGLASDEYFVGWVQVAAVAVNLAEPNPQLWGDYVAGGATLVNIAIDGVSLTSPSSADRAFKSWISTETWDIGDYECTYDVTNLTPNLGNHIALVVTGGTATTEGEQPRFVVGAGDQQIKSLFSVTSAGTVGFRIGSGSGGNSGESHYMYNVFAGAV